MGKTITLPSKKGEPAWELAELFPYQGSWSEDDYLHLETNKLIEFTDGYVELLPMPSQIHQYIALFLYRLLAAFAEQRNLGETLAAPFPVRLDNRRYREPDVLFMLAQNSERRHHQYWEGADLAMEVVSPDDPQRDTVQKRAEYAEAGIPEYWIVNPLDETITVLTLGEDGYDELGVFGRGEESSSLLLQGFTVSVDDVFDAPR